MNGCYADICMAGCYGDYTLYVPIEAINRLPRWHEDMFDPDSGLPMGAVDNEYDEDDPADVEQLENQNAAIEVYLEYLESTPPVPDDEMNRAIYGPSWGRIAQEGDG